MKSNYVIVQPWILAYEGGYVNHPKDPGGATNQGITQKTYDAFRRRVGKPTRSVKQLEAVERDTIYRQQYWDVIRGDDLPSGVDAAVYDFAVNSGPSRAASYLQAVVGVKQDGVIGLQTLDAVDKMDAVIVIDKLCAARFSFLQRLKHWPTFKVGWTRRVIGNYAGAQENDTGILDRATKLAQGQKVISKPKFIKDGAGVRTGDAPPKSNGGWFVGVIMAIVAAAAAYFGVIK